jgi:hypothetical protein
MFGILLSAGNALLAWLVRVVVMKALIFGVLLAITTAASSYLLTKLEASPLANLETSLGQLGSGTLWLLGILRMDVGLPLLLSAHFTAFAIRRLPVIG